MKTLWILAQGEWEKTKPLVTTALETGYSGVVTEEPEKVKQLGRINTIGKKGDIKLVDEKNPGAKGKKATIVEIKNKEDEQRAASLAKKVDYVVIDCRNWKIIPLENLIAQTQKTGSKLIALVKNKKEAQTALETLEVGVDGVLVDTKNLSEIKQVAQTLRSFEQLRLPLVKATVVNVKSLGMGDRVCIDTTALLKPGEGMLVGSQSSGMFLVHAETEKNPYVAPRPFRVNAGSVHSYTLNPAGKTNYLCELEAGSEILIVDKKGKTRKEHVGRSKIERRPMMLIEAKHAGEIYKVILQNAETIKIVNAEGKPVPVTSLKKKDKILLYSEEGARHFGMKVKETIIEK